MPVLPCHVGAKAKSAGSASPADTPSRRRRSSLGGGGTPGSPRAGRGGLWTLLLNTRTKDEGEEFLEYCYPPEDPEIQALASMKGVFLASCGVMRAAVGQEISYFVFWSADGARQYKAVLCQVEDWVLCTVLPAATTDRVGRFLAQAAAELIALRHGGLASVRGQFRQLDPIFRALGSAWLSLGETGAEGDHGLTASPCLLYMVLGVVLRTSPADEWQEEVRQRMCDWERAWRLSITSVPLAIPEGFALFLDQALVSTSLEDAVFDACLRLCLLEGVWDSQEDAPPGEAAGGPLQPHGDDGSGMRCHSVFLRRRGGGAVGAAGAAAAQEGGAALPSHQYCVLRRGPWALFMLWRMSCEDDVPPPAVNLVGAAPASRDRGGCDPFGTDACLEVLSCLPLPEGYAARAAAAGAGAATARGARAAAKFGSPVGQREALKRSFSLPCPAVFKPLLSRSSSKQGKVGFVADRPSRFLHALELRGTGEQALHTEGGELCGGDSAGSRAGCPAAGADAAGDVRGVAAEAEDGWMEDGRQFGATRTPRLAAADRLSAAAGLACPEMASRMEDQAPSEWMGARGGASLGLLSAWGELDALAAEHARKRAAWLAAPPPAACRHAAVGALRGGQALDKLWRECLVESGRGGATAGPAAGAIPGAAPGAAPGPAGAFAPPPRGPPRERPAPADGPTLLGSGEPWRFQAGAPFWRADLPPLLGAGALAGAGSAAAWAGVAELRSAAATAAPAAGRRVLLQLSRGPGRAPAAAPAAAAPGAGPPPRPAAPPKPAHSGSPPARNGQ